MITQSEKLARESAKNATADAIKSGDIDGARHNYQVMLDLKAKAETKPFFEQHGTELVSLNGWLGEPRFTVEELYQAFKTRVILDLEAALVAEFGA